MEAAGISPLLGAQYKGGEIAIEYKDEKSKKVSNSYIDTLLQCDSDYHLLISTQNNVTLGNLNYANCKSRVEVWGLPQFLKMLAYSMSNEMIKQPKFMRTYLQRLKNRYRAIFKYQCSLLKATMAYEKHKPVPHQSIFM